MQEEGTPEQWRPAVGYEGRYEVSDHGRVRSLRFRNRMTDKDRRAPLVLRPQLRRGGYRWVTLGDNGQPQQRPVARLVLEAFVGPCPPGLECCHWDDDGANNRLTNLRWDTRVANRADQDRLGNTLRGERSAASKLTEAQVREMKARYAAGGLRHSDLAPMYGVSVSTVSAIMSGRIWRHIP